MSSELHPEGLTLQVFNAHLQSLLEGFLCCSKKISFCGLALSLCSWAFAADGSKAETYVAGSFWFKITTPSGKVILTDPWLMANPKTPAEYKKLENLGKIDVLLVSHAHWDHFADAPAIAKMNNIPMWGPGDLNSVTVALGILPPNLAPRFNKSGTVTPVPGIQVTAVHAEHSSILVWKNPQTQLDETHFGGEPIGFIIELENGFKIYHMGDTGLFSDMKFIAEYYKPDLVMMPIGGNFTMGPKEAAFAAKEWPKVPTCDPHAFWRQSIGQRNRRGVPKAPRGL
jgi:L-ascorbate metabolism protein UlaG (beta-lactamase superfamily)